MTTETTSRIIELNAIRREAYANNDHATHAAATAELETYCTPQEAVKVERQARRGWK